jgi:hypothetical protein
MGLGERLCIGNSIYWLIPTVPIRSVWVRMVMGIADILEHGPMWNTPH